MNNTIREELTEYINENKDDYSKEDLHFHLFNEDYYIIGYYEAGQWLKKHDIGELEGAGICTQYEKDQFGECNTVYDNTEKVVNMLTYIWGYELLIEMNLI